MSSGYGATLTSLDLERKKTPSHPAFTNRRGPTTPYIERSTIVQPAGPILGTRQLDEQAEDRFDVTIWAVVAVGSSAGCRSSAGDPFSSGFAHQP